jgi:hypothetical protein
MVFFVPFGGQTIMPKRFRYRVHSIGDADPSTALRSGRDDKIKWLCFGREGKMTLRMNGAADESAPVVHLVRA